eukprot:2492533-Amphidinium_carterae.1
MAVRARFSTGAADDEDVWSDRGTAFLVVSCETPWEFAPGAHTLRFSKGPTKRVATADGLTRTLFAES